MSKKLSKSEFKNFVFRKHANVGAADAIEDKKFLSESFIDNGEIAILADNNQPQCIVLGRTGSGKTALLERLDKTQEKIIKIAPEGLALTHIANNEVLNFFAAAGVNMDLFYRLLWRHVFAVEIIREHYHIVNEQARDSFITQIKDRILRNRPRQDAIDYLLKWGPEFWLESEYRVKEVTKKLEEDLGQSINGTFGGSLPGLSEVKVNLSSESVKKLSEEQKSEIVQRGQSVVDKVQMKILSSIMDLLEQDILHDKQKKYYITIDRLDDNWVNDELRYKLIKALLDTVRDFNNKIQNVKIVIAIREDLLDRVFRYTRSAGYQEEKYKSMYLVLSWKERELEEMLDRRVNQLVREQYTTTTVKLRDLLPDKINKQDAVEYILARTMLRPRDAIMFFNECIKAGEGKARLTQAMVYQAEGFYSENRIRALADEWSTDYPNLIEMSFFLKKLPSKFKQSDIEDQVEEHMFEFLTTNVKEDYIFNMMQEKFDNSDKIGFLQEAFKILFRTGIIGVKQESYSNVLWSYQGHNLIGSEIDTSASFHVHPAFWRVLGIQP